MTLDYKTIEHWGHAESSRLRKNLETAGYWVVVVLTATGAWAGWWLT